MGIPQERAGKVGDDGGEEDFLALRSGSVTGGDYRSVKVETGDQSRARTWSWRPTGKGNRSLT